jgi:hypothetical protein
MTVHLEDPGQIPLPPFEEVAEDIVKIAEAMRAIEKTRLRWSTIVDLLHAKSKVPKRQIEFVLNNLRSFDDIWLKPIEKK